jgi:PAS domain S-box-containing protein
MVKPYFQIFLTLVLIVTLFVYINNLQEKRVNVQNQINLVRINQQNTNSLKASLQIRLQLPTSLASIVEIDPNFALQNFDAITKTLINDLTGIISLQLAPNGIVTYVTDIARNQAAIGYNLLTDKRSKTLSLLAIKERRFTIAGPLTLRQGGKAIIARLPIYTKLQHTKSTASFWGFATILIDVDTLLAESHILSDDEHHSVALRGKDSGGQKDAVIFGNQEVFDNPADIRVIDLPYFSWEMAIKGKGRYIERVNPNWIKWLLFIGGLLSITSIYLIMSRFNRKKVLVEQARISNDLTQLIDTANAPIFGIDGQGQVNEWNQQSEKITGFSKDEVMGRDLVADFITDDYKTSVGEVLEKALKGEETANYAFPLFTKSGDRVDVLLNSTTRRDASGQIVGVVGVGQDITELNRVLVEQEVERKDAAVQIIQASKLATLGEMSTSVAHELNQPLNVIRMASGKVRRKLSKGTVDPEYLNDKLERIEAQTARAAAIIDHMRMFGREANENPEPIDARNVVTNALDLVGEQLRLAEIEIVTELAENCPSILGHNIQLEQVILNLLTNARDAIGESEGEAKVTLRVFSDDEGVQISVEDTGGGIPEEILPRIFEPFYTTKEMGIGTGLGLSVSYGIVRDMNGTIVAKNIDGGARFTITLPSVSR